MILDIWHTFRTLIIIIRHYNARRLLTCKAGSWISKRGCEIKSWAAIRRHVPQCPKSGEPDWTCRALRNSGVVVMSWEPQTQKLWKNSIDQDLKKLSSVYATVLIMLISYFWTYLSTLHSRHAILPQTQSSKYLMVCWNAGNSHVF